MGRPMTDQSPALGPEASPGGGPWPSRSDLIRLQEDQRLRWGRGERVLVEDYLSTLPQPPDEPEDVLDLIYHEVLVREELGDDPGLDEYLRRFPQFAGPLRDQFRVHEALKGAVSRGPAGVGSTAGVSTVVIENPAAAGALPTIPGFEMVRELGRGGMGIVYLARQAGLNRLVALKMILACEYACPRDRSRFRDEAEAVARLSHPNLVQIFEMGEHEGRPYFSMEYVDGGRLADALRGSPWSPLRAARLVETLARAAQSAHERGVIHRDLTPSNVLLTAAGEPRVVDFGLAKLTGGAGRTTSGEVLGTPGYMAPEQAVGRSHEVGPGADVYALGAVLYELLTGRPPFVGDSLLDVLAQVVRDDPVSPCRLQHRVPRDLETVCLKCLNKDPRRRYPSAAALADDLGRYLAGEPVLARPIGAAGRAARWAQRRPALAALLALAAAGTLVAFALIAREGRLARIAQGRAEGARRSETAQRVAADAAREREAWQRRSYQGLSAVLLRERAARHCEEGDVDRGLLWLAESLRLVPEADGALGRAIRADLAGWLGQFHPLRGIIEHPPQVLAAGWSPDGRLVATTGADGTVRLWDAATGEARAPALHLPQAVSAVAFSPDGTMIFAAAGSRGRLWRTGGGEPAVLDLGEGGELLAASFHRDGQRLYTAVRRGPSTWLRAWQPDTGRRISAEVDLGPSVDLVTFSPDGRSLVTGCETAGARSRLWRCDDGTPVRELREHRDRVVAIAFDPGDRQRFVTGSYDHTCRLWDGCTGEPLGPVLRLSGAIRAVAFHPHHDLVLVGGHDRIAQFWNLADRALPGPPMHHPDAVKVVRFSPDGRVALTASWGQVRLWDAGTGEPIGAPLPHQREVVEVSFSPDSRAVLTRAREGVVRIWPTAPAQPVGRRIRHRGWVTAVAFHPAGGSFLTAIGGMEGKVLAWRTAMSKAPDVALADLGPIFSLAYRTDGRAFAAGTMQRKVWLAGDEAAHAAGFPLALDGWAWSVAFSPDGRTLLTGHAGGRAQFWDAVSGRERPGPLVHAKAVHAVAYSPDGRTVLTGSEDMTARLWDAATHRPTGVSLTHQGSVYSVAFRPPDGQLIATGSDDRTARLWEAETGRPVGRPLRHPARVLAVTFSPDGRIVATGCGDGAARLWDTATGHPIGRPLPHRGPVRAVAFDPRTGGSPDQRGGLTLVTGSEDMTARVWAIPPSLDGSPEQILNRLQAAIGMRLDPHGVPDSLTLAAWQRVRRKLDAGHEPSVVDRRP